MQPINRRPPDSMTVEARMDEVSALLARGICRLWEKADAKSAIVAGQSHLGLGGSGHPSVHMDPPNPVTESK